MGIFQFEENLDNLVSEVDASVVGNELYLEKSFNFDGSTYVDTNIEISTTNIKTVCFDIYTEQGNQRAKLFALASKKLGFEILLWNGDLR